MPSDNENGASDTSGINDYSADRFIPSRDAGSVNAMYSALDDARSQESRSPEPNKGTCVRR